MGERRGTKALELWCKRITNGYPSVNVQNMTTSWRDGLAFCAMIHHFRPDLIDFSSLDKSDIYGNNELAFRTAEQHLGIPALLDAEDMASCSVPDRLSILTYLSQFYQVFGGSSSNRVALNSTSEKSSDRIKSISEAPQPKVSSRLGMRKDLCVSCDLPIFLAEKLMIARNAYHRNCFRCIRCHQQLTPGNYYETEDGQYRCEACPDDEVSTVILLEALSDEEKNKRRVFEREQQQVKEDDDNDNKFDEMIRMINDKIDELTSECEEQATSPNAMQKRDSRVNNASNVLECRRTSNNEDLETLKKRATPVLKKSDSLSAYEHIIKESRFVQRPLRLFEQAPILNMECEMESEPLSQVENHYVQKTRSISKNDYPENLNPFASNDKRTEVSSKLKLQEEKCSMNPFDCTDEVMPDETDQPSKLVLRLRSHKATEIPIKRLLEAPKINLNPFWSDDDRESSPDSELETKSKSPPVPKPRTLRYSDVDEDPLLYSKLNLTSIGIHSSNTSIASSCSTPGGTYRKKKPAPLPPPIQHQSYNTSSKSINITINSDLSLSPKLPFKMRKSKLAPAPPFPPTAASTPTRTLNWKNNTSDLLDESLDPRCSDNDVVKQHHLWNEEKLSKDEANRNTQNHLCSESSTYLIYPTNKSIEGKWKRKKGPAPPRPVPLRRKIKVMSMKDIKLELDQIEMQQQGLEKQGVRLEQIIRDKCESNTTSGEDINLGLDLEELILELFTLVNEKNELFRRQTELMLLRRQQRLEEEHADIEYEVRCLLTQPEATKTDFDKQREEILIQRLVEVVERRNEIVECLEMDRKREIEEDRSIHKEMDLYAVKSKSNIDLTDASRCLPKSKKGKIKGKKLKKTNKKDADKDVDETEAKLKRHNLRKWF